MSETSVDQAALAEPLSVVVHLAFAFDIGDEINLDLARQMLQRELGQIPRRKRTPESIRCPGFLAEVMEIEAASLFERVDNALKLIGDPYLSRVFALALSRCHLRGW